MPPTLTRTDEDRQEVRAWLWRVVLADGTRTLTTTGRWPAALAHIEQHHGIGTRMLDGRQIAVITALTEGDTDLASGLLKGTARGEPWEQAVTSTLAALVLQDTGRKMDTDFDDLVDNYLRHQPNSGMTVFDMRLGLITLDTAASAAHPRSRRLVDEIARGTRTARDGYAARELLADHVFAVLATDDQAQECHELSQACGLESGFLTEEYAASLSAGLYSSENAIKRSICTKGDDDAQSSDRDPEIHNEAPSVTSAGVV